MEHKDWQDKQLAELLREMPEVEPTSQIMQSVMGRIKPKRQSFWRQFSDLLISQRMFLCKLTLTMASLFLAFWIGTNYQTSSGAGIVAEQQVLEAALGSNPQANFLVGQGLFESGAVKKALPYLLQAVKFAPQNSDYLMWAGAGEGAIGNYVSERKYYAQAIMLQPDNYQASLYMGHSLADAGSYLAALYYYDQVLAVKPLQPAALYNKALVLAVQGVEEDDKREAWAAYLENYRSGKWAYRAVEHLNNLGDFSYRTHLVGSRRVILSSSELWGLSGQSSLADVTGLEEIVSIVRTQQVGFGLYVLAYAAGEPLLAKEKALTVQRKIRQYLPESRRGNIRASWFGVPEVRTVGSESYKTTESIILLGYTKNKGEVSI